MGMTLMERDNFRQKMLDEYGPGWESIVKDYGGMVNPQVGPQHGALVPGAMSFDPTRFRTDNPLSLLSSREDIELALREPIKSPNISFSPLPTKEDRINELRDELREMDPEGRDLIGNEPLIPSFKDKMSTSPDGTRIPFPSPGNNELRDQINALYAQGQSNYYGPSGFQNRISPLPHQLEGPETSPGDGSVPARFYDPNQKLYDPYYYGTAGQMGQMGAPPPGIIPSSVTGRHISPNAPYSVTGMSAMSGGEMPGLLDSGEQFSQAFPGPDPDNRIAGEFPELPEWASQPAGPLAETGEGGKWEKTPEGEDSIYGRKRKDGMDDYIGKYFMGLGTHISGGPSKWSSR